MYSFNFREVEMKNGKKRLLIDFEDEKKELLSTFLESEVTTFSDNIFYCLEQVLENKSSYEEFNGNVCGLEFQPDYTQIFDNLAEDGKGNWCKVNTKTLRKLALIWLEKSKEYNEKGKI